MGYSLIAAMQSRDSPVDEFSCSSGRGLLSPEDRRSLAMPKDWTPLGGREAGKPLRDEMYRGSHPLQTLFLPVSVSIYFPETDT